MHLVTLANLGGHRLTFAFFLFQPCLFRRSLVLSFFLLLGLLGRGPPFVRFRLPHRNCRRSSCTRILFQGANLFRTRSKAFLSCARHPAAIVVGQRQQSFVSSQCQASVLTAKQASSLWTAASRASGIKLSMACCKSSGSGASSGTRIIGNRKTAVHLVGPLARDFVAASDRSRDDERNRRVHPT